MGLRKGGRQIDLLGPVTICPVGSVDKEILEFLAERISTRCELVCGISQGLENPHYAYSKTRCQYNSKLILKRLLQSCTHDTVRLIGITPVDLYVPVLKYVFGVALIEGKCAVISLHRLRPQFYDQPSDRHLFMTRVEKTAIHEIGHSFGLTHCRDRRCVMYPSTRIKDTDFKQADFCASCFELFRWYIKKYPMPINP